MGNRVILRWAVSVWIGLLAALAVDPTSCGARVYAFAAIGVR
jgi:hypothetical protein